MRCPDCDGELTATRLAAVELSWRCPRCATDSLELGEIAGVGAALCADCRARAEAP